MLKKRLKELRLNNGLTLKELGSYIGMAESTVSLYESGKREPDLLTVQKIADYFNVSTDYLLGKTDVPNPELPEEKIELPEGLKFAHLNGIKELDNEDRMELIKMMERMIELDRLRKERQNAKG